MMIAVASTCPTEISNPAATVVATGDKLKPMAETELIHRKTMIRITHRYQVVLNMGAQSNVLCRFNLPYETFSSVESIT